MKATDLRDSHNRSEYWFIMDKEANAQSGHLNFTVMKLKRFSLLPILDELSLTSCHCEHGEVDGLLSSLQVGTRSFGMGIYCPWTDSGVLRQGTCCHSFDAVVLKKLIILVMQFTFMIPTAGSDSLGIARGDLTEEDENRTLILCSIMMKSSHRWLSKTFDLWSYGNWPIFLLSGNSSFTVVLTSG